MKGVVKAINEACGMVAVETDGGFFSIFELTSGDRVEIGDEVYWKNDAGLGGEQLTNLTYGDRFEVNFQNHHVQETDLRQQLLLD